MDRIEAEKKLNEIFKIDHFYDTQWSVIEKILKGEKVLLIEKTGFGKSLCFQFPALLFEGTTIVFTPLIALMRDQVNKLDSLGIIAKCINSNQDNETNSRIIQEAIKNQIKILYIAPERMENIEWLNAARQMNISMIVVDEAHCISTWGHDFRPAYKRIVNLVNLLHANFPVLATTATATKSVEEDIKQQIGKGIYSYRGNLIRDNFRLFVIKVNSEDEKLIWLGQNLNKIDGTGLVYTGTRTNTEIYAKWFDYIGIKSTFYNADLEPATREEIEKGLLANRWKCIVSTNALGMGVDKPDIRFIVHTQTPISPIHYYQEIGRAGRDGKNTFIILFFNPNDDLSLPKAFIEGSKPSISKYQKVISALKNERLGEQKLMKATNLKQNEVRTIKADLIEQNIINEVNENKSKIYEIKFNAPEVNFQPFNELKEHKTKDFEKMIEYINLESCRMDFLCNYLGDASSNKCNKCDNDTNHIVTMNYDDSWKQKIDEFHGNYFPVLEVSSHNGKLIDGVAASFYGVSNVGKMIHHSKYENGGDFPDNLLKLALRAFKKKFKDLKFDLIIYVPPTVSGNLVRNFAQKLSEILKIPISHNLHKSRETKPQKIFQNAVLKKENVQNVFSYSKTNEIMNKNILLIDDIFDSGYTVKEIGKYLIALDVALIAPLVIAKTVGGDL
ncbi:MAG: RecQ family ATP-dependent DNA helicase [Candidatus Kapabacteria bacterium]|nr:RecQ family ATP-dependent DNA helicase [Candidatus Kapabacteria bacterium]